MTRLSRNQKIGLLGLLVGTLLLIALVSRTGLENIAVNLIKLRSYFILLILISGLRFFLRTLAWHYSIEPGHRSVGKSALFKFLVVGEAITDLTFVGPVLGEPAKAFMAGKRIPMLFSISSVAMENLLYRLTVFLFIISGAFILVSHPALPQNLRIASFLAGASLFLFLGATYWLLKRRWFSLSGLLKWFKDRFDHWRFPEYREEPIRSFEENIYNFYGRHRRLFFGILTLEALALFTGVIETDVILKWTTGRFSLSSAYLVEAMNRLVNTLFAFVPLQVGVGEGGAAAVLSGLGYSASAGVSLAIIRKIRSLFWIAVGLVFMAGYSLKSQETKIGPSQADEGKTK